MEYQEIKRRMETLVSQPAKHIAEDVMEKVIKELRQKTPKSVEGYNRLLDVI